jgi:flavin reductase (DIM6/NTAB) family NADH-FMN oxidoreductase RutF
MDKTALYKISYGLYVVGVRHGEGFGGCTVDAFIQSTDAPPTAILCSMQRSLTNALIKENREFTLSILPAGVDPFIIANFGFQSARTADKWANVETEWHNGLPALCCACAGLYLRMTDIREQGSHSVFFCDIIDAWTGEGTPLLYADYQRDLKPKTMTAFQAFLAK